MKTTTQLPVKDVSARTTMKGAAKCDKLCELQHSLNQKKIERKLLFRVVLKSLFASVSFVSPRRRVTQNSRFSCFIVFYVVLVALAHVSFVVLDMPLNIFLGVM